MVEEVTKLSPTQQAVIARLREEPTGQLRRIPGGFWTTPSTPRNARGVPEWWVYVQTVHALEKLGWLVRQWEYQEEWRDTRIAAEKPDPITDPEAYREWVAAETMRKLAGQEGEK